MRTNMKTPAPPIVTHEGGRADRITEERMLRRSVLSCLLFEDEFYEGGQAIAARIKELVAKVPAAVTASLALEARQVHNLRHVPLLLTALLAAPGSREGALLEGLVAGVVRRADELAELLAVHATVWGVTPKTIRKKIPAAMKRGLARAFQRFDEYQLGKYNRDADIKLRDVMRMVHPKPQSDEQRALWGRLIKGELATPDTWEVQLSAGADKKATWERLIREGKLGYFALLRNLRGMMEAGVDPTLVKDAILARKGGADKLLPFRFTAAARAAPQFEPQLDAALQENLKGEAPLPGLTFILVDVSQSMDAKLSGKSDLSRMDAAATLAAIVPAQHLRVFTFSMSLVEVPPRRGMAGVDAIRRSQPHGGTYLARALQELNKMPHDRLVVVTDEQTADGILSSVAKRAYLINVASSRNGVGYGKGWVHIDGFSESVIRFIREIESELDR